MQQKSIEQRFGLQLSRLLQHSPDMIFTGSQLQHVVGTKGRLGWHTTKSIDYGVVLSGELELHVEEQTAPTRLKPGDVTVMRANNDAWVNPGSVPCTVAFVLISWER